ncbi:MAG: hypothetical protein KUG76_01555 [Gammaproteobacteria bacterium]|nr:hypothetical protein [Gammaproteobacteria bacterium]
MSDSFFEVVQLANGDIALKRTGESSEPMVTIHFSEDVKTYLGNSLDEVGRAMIGAGVDSASKVTELEDDFGNRARVIH